MIGHEVRSSCYSYNFNRNTAIFFFYISLASCCHMMVCPASLSWVLKSGGYSKEWWFFFLAYFSEVQNCFFSVSWYYSINFHNSTVIDNFFLIVVGCVCSFAASTIPHRSKPTESGRLSTQEGKSIKIVGIGLLGVQNPLRRYHIHWCW